jgi:hypothetical protein
MVDIETYATHHYAPIISIGAVAFDPADPRRDFENFPEFLVNIDLESNLKIGRHMDPGAVMFWSEPAQADALAQWKKTLKFELALALQGFTQWIEKVETEGDPLGKIDAIWSYGSIFDLVILGTAFTQLGIEQPWTYKNERCFRTLKSLAPDAQVPQVGTTHNALDDARYQTRLFYQVAKELNLKF